MLKAYLKLMRVDRPIGTFLLMWPTLWALWLANRGSPSVKLIFVFVLGSFLMRTAGCVINDFIDRDIDGKVFRTKSRALVSGEVSALQALILLAILLCLAFFLVIQLNIFTIKISFIALLLTGIYPILKRYTGMVQIFLGSTFGLGVLMSFAASINSIPMHAWFLYLINVAWIVAYDTIYAMLDKPDDVKIGIRSTAIVFGNYDRYFVLVLQFIVGFSLILYGITLQLGSMYLVSVLLACSLFFHQYKLVLTKEYENYFLAFKNNNWVGALVFLGFMFADYSKASMFLLSF